jgi:hypothetical protein
MVSTAMFRYITLYVLWNQSHGNARREYRNLWAKADADVQEHWGW